MPAEKRNVYICDYCGKEEKTMHHEDVIFMLPTGWAHLTINIHHARRNSIGGLSTVKKESYRNVCICNSCAFNFSLHAIIQRVGKNDSRM